MDNPPSSLRLHFFTLFLLYTHSHLCLAADRIYTDQPLLSNQTLISAAGVFELGFFSPANSKNSYLGIWYRNISPPTVVWVLNRNNPIPDSSSSELRITNGTLFLFRSPNVPIWAATVSSSSALEAVLQDDGNFVITTSNSSSNSSSDSLWQSFDYPTDTLLPGQKLGRKKMNNEFTSLVSWNSESDPAQGAYSLQLDPKGTIQYVTLYNNNSTMYAIPGRELMNNDSYTENDGEVYFSFSGVSLSRIVLNSKGMVQRLSWAEGSEKWLINWQEPRDQCQVFAYCGPFGSCDIDSSPLCSCPTGFIPKSEKEWSLRDFSRGCLRKSRLGCRNEDTNDKNDDMFVPGFGLPDEGGQLSVGGLRYSVGSDQQCESVCSYSCNCTAYSYQRNGCSIWSGELFNLRTLRKDRYNESVYIRIAGSEKPDDVSSISRSRVVIGAIVGSVVSAILVTVLTLFLILRRNSRRKAAVKMGEIENEKNKYGIMGRDDQNNTQLSFFSLKDVLVATDNFSESNKLGEGGFGPVYKGKLSGDQEVAMKRLSKKSGQGLEEFMNELKLIAKLQHTYLVRLLGCCVEQEEKILIYEYMPNRSLDKFLFGSSHKAKLDWGQRVKIAEGVAQGLLYIHKYSRLKVIHRDMKASNVLLDAAMNPKISDFGMARIFGIDQDEANTNRIVGTYGYMSPEYAFYGQFSEKSDVFSFGVLLLEIVSGRRNKDFYHHEIPFSLLCWVWELWKEGKAEELIDPAVKNSTCCSPSEAVKLIHVGILCVQEAPTDRPTMSSVTQMLSSNDSQSFPSPGEPAFIARRAAAAEISDHVPVDCSNNQITISLPTGR
ncbi:Receptor-like serine/threonine-protein kinase SD1-8 [Linum grandiflorum]